LKYIGLVFALLASSLQNAQAATVPCAQLHLGGSSHTPTCPNPFVQGVVDGQWIGLLVHYTGGNDGIDKITAFSIGEGAMAPTTFNLGTITTDDAYGFPGDMEARIVHGKLWIITPNRDANHQSHFGFTSVLVRQYGFYGRNLEIQKRAIVPMPGNVKGMYPSSAAISAALQRE
jgi:hypothetical protein